MRELVGQTLSRYQILALLGEGGMGAVFKAQDPILQREVALKVMHPHLARQPGFSERFLQEARSAAHLDHPGIVKVFDFGQDRDLLFIVMELIRGDTLHVMLRDLRSSSKWLPLLEAVQLVREVALALDYAHRQGILHRDIKPDNIMLKPDPSDPAALRPVITDLGLAKLREGGVHTEDGTSLGTPAYMSPEQAMGQPVDARSDVYSLGILLYQLAVGRLPFEVQTITAAIRAHTQLPPPPPRTLRPDLPPALERIILQALAKDPAARYPAAAAFAQALATALPAATQVTGAPPTLAATSLKTQYQSSLLKPRGESLFVDLPAPAAAGQDRIVIRSPDGSQRTVPIPAAELIVGRGSDAGIVLDDPKVSRQHIKITCDGTTYRVADLGSTNGTLLANAKLLPGIPQEWTPDQPLRIGNHWLFLQRSGQPGKSAVLRADGTVVAATQLQSSANQQLAVFLEPTRLSVDPGASVTAALTIINQGAEVDHFQIAIAGVPPTWLPEALPTVQLMPGQQQTVAFTIRPPRTQSRAGDYPLTVRVMSEKDPGQVAQIGAELAVARYGQFSSQLKPERLRAGAPGQLIIENQGNVDETLAVTWTDRGGELAFNAAQTQVTVAAGQQNAITFRSAPRQRRWIGGPISHPFTAQVTSLQDQPRLNQGEIISTGRFPPWLPAVLIFLCVIVSTAAALLLSQQNKKVQAAQARAIAATATAASIAQANADAIQAAAVAATSTAQYIGRNQVAAATATAEAATATATWLQGDDDRDGLGNSREQELGTLPNNRDTDADGLSDGVEVNERRTDPLKDDTDGDGWKDGIEMEKASDPLKEDTDGDGISDPSDPDPRRPPTPTPRPSPTPVPTPTPLVEVWSDATQVTPGQCTTLHWNIQHVNAVFLDNSPVPNQSERKVCPRGSKTYTWSITTLWGGQDQREITVELQTMSDRDMWMLVTFKEDTGSNCEAAVCAGGLDRVIEYLLPKPQVCGTDPYPGDTVEVVWDSGQSSVIGTIRSGEVVEVYGQCFIDISWPAIWVRDPPYFARKPSTN